MSARTRLHIGCSVALFAFAPFVRAEQNAPPAKDTIEEILDRQEARGKDLKDIASKLEYIKEDKVLEEKETLKGKLQFREEDPNPRFLIEFEQRVQDGTVEPIKEWHAFDGRYYIEARESTKNIIKHEVLRKGEDRHVFKLGEGPFPLPFGQKKKDIKETFDIALVPFNAKTDPPNTNHLQCKPKTGTAIQKRYGNVDFWISKESNLPVKVETTDKEDHDKSITAIFTEMQINKGIAGSKLEFPPLPGYKTTDDPLPPEEASKTPAK